MPGEYTICLDPTIPPVQNAYRKVPNEVREEIEKKTHQYMVDQGIITPVTEPGEWVSSLTYSRKSNGTINPCLDPHNLKIAIIREHYKVPTLDEIYHRLSSTTVFSKHDVKDGFWSIHLDTPSSYHTTFNTHMGYYWYLYLPFGIKMSQDVFQVCMDQFSDIVPGITAIHDDICIYMGDRGRIQHTLIIAYENSLKEGISI